MKNRMQDNTNRILLLALFGISWLVLTGFEGCSQKAPTPTGREVFLESERTRIFMEDPAERDSALYLLANMQMQAMREAYPALRAFNYSQYQRTEQFDEQGLLIAFREYVYRYLWRGGRQVRTLIESDSAGTFDFGYFRKFVSSTGIEAMPEDLSQYVLPDEPVFLAPRGQELYVFRLRPDTLMWDRVARTVEIRARPGVGDFQGIRLVRLYIDRATNYLIGAYLERMELALLFKEQSAFYLDIRPIEDHWVPNNARFETLVGLPFSAPRHFRTVATFYDYEPVEERSVAPSG